jgi:hypothetical protein
MDKGQDLKKENKNDLEIKLVNHSSYIDRCGNAMLISDQLISGSCFIEDCFRMPLHKVAKTK